MVLIGPAEVAGMAQGLQQGLTQIGIASELVLECQHPFHYAAQEASSPLIKGWKWGGTQARKLPMRQFPLKALAYAWHLVLGWPVLCWALFRYDAFVFLAGKTLTGTRFDLWLMRALHKPVVMIFLGTDSRPAYINGVSKALTAVAMQRAARRQKRKLGWIERLATACVNAPGTAHFHEVPVINWFALGFPRFDAASKSLLHPGRPPNGTADGPPETTSATAAVEGKTAAPVRVVHSPSKPMVKGTAQIQAVVDRLKRRGLNLELVTLTGLTNEQVLAALQDCDLLVDQLYSDTPMAGLATEAAWLSKPALVGGYIARDMPQALRGMPVPPTRFVEPERFEQALEELVMSSSARRALASAALHFVQTEWSCPQVATRLVCILRGEVPTGWWFDPATVNYLAGCGLSEEAARERVRLLIAHAGVGALQLADKPELEQAFANWAQIQTAGQPKFNRIVS